MFQDVPGISSIESQVHIYIYVHIPFQYLLCASFFLSARYKERSSSVSLMETIGGLYLQDGPEVGSKQVKQILLPFTPSPDFVSRSKTPLWKPKKGILALGDPSKQDADVMTRFLRARIWVLPQAERDPSQCTAGGTPESGAVLF